jgi:predicted  nucleic acid-binding Zn-ribbon protein
MAVTRKMLKGMSLTEEQIDTIIEAHTDVVDALKEERDRYKADAEKLPAVEKELKELKASGGDFETKYNDLKKQFDDYKSEQSAAAEKAAKETAYKEMLKEAGVSEKRIASIMRVTNLADIQLDKEGKLKDKEKIVENVKSEWADFIDTKDIKGADTKTPPANNGGKLTKEDILKIKDTTERQQKIAENHELFGF